MFYVAGFPCAHHASIKGLEGSLETSNCLFPRLHAQDAFPERRLQTPAVSGQDPGPICPSLPSGLLDSSCTVAGR